MLFGEVVSRYFFNLPIMWAGELGRYLFIWIVYLGASVAITQKEHIVVSFVVEKFPPMIQYYIELIIHFIMIVFFFFVFYYGIHYTGTHMHIPAFSMRQIRMGWV
ncbi:MAG: TRAP transporter small permease, partial [Atribacterota bacterium]